MKLNKILLFGVLSTFAFSYANDFIVLIKNDQKSNYNSLPALTEWENIGDEYNCKNHSPLSSNYYNDDIFTQSYECSQDQERTSALNGIEKQTILISHIEDVYGTKEYSDCYEHLQNGKSTNGYYTINPTGTNAFSAYCNMTVDGGGWTLVFYSNSDNVPLTSINSSDWNEGATINFSRLYSFKDKKRNGKYEFFVKDSSTVGRYVIFNQTNSYLENPVGNSFRQTGGNFYYDSSRNVTTWKGLAISSYGDTAMRSSCTLSMAYYGNSWWYCVQDQKTGAYGTGPWFYNSSTSQDAGAGSWIQVYQR